MHDTGIGTAADDGVVGDIRIVRTKFMQHLGHDLVLHSPGTRKAHCAAVSAHGDLCGAPQTALFGAALVEPHVVEHMPQRNKFVGRTGGLPCLHPQAIDPTHDMGIEVRVHTHGVIDLRARFHQSGQNFVDVRDWKGVVRPVALDGALGSGSSTVPRLAQGVVLTHEQQVFRLGAARYEHRDGVRFRESAQVVEVAILPIGVLDVAVAMAHGCRRQDRDGVLADHAHELAPPARELLAIHRLAQCSRCCAG